MLLGCARKRYPKVPSSVFNLWQILLNYCQGCASAPAPVQDCTDMSYATEAYQRRRRTIDGMPIYWTGFNVIVCKTMLVEQSVIPF